METAAAVTRLALGSGVTIFLGFLVWWEVVRKQKDLSPRVVVLLVILALALLLNAIDIPLKLAGLP